MKNMNRNVFRSLLPFTLLFLLAIPSQAQDSGVVEQVKNCARVTDKSVRIACYEELGTRVLNEDNLISEVPGAEATDTPPKPAPLETAQPSKEATKSELPDSIGGGKFSKTKKKKKVEKKSFKGLVTSCKKSASNKWFYFFDNGQIWKQVDSDNRWYKKCNFQVTITKDTFGYKMKIDGKRGTVRIRRQKK